MADAGAILFGRVGREILGVAQLLFFYFRHGEPYPNVLDHDERFD